MGRRRGNRARPGGDLMEWPGFEACWCHPLVAVETFTDPCRHLGTRVKASNFLCLGIIPGSGRRAERFVHRGG